MPLSKAPALQQVGQFPLYSKVKCQCTNESLEATLQPHSETCTHTQSKAADSSPFPQISTTESACAPFPAWGWEGIVRFSAMKDLSLPPHLVLGNYGQRQDTFVSCAVTDSTTVESLCSRTHPCRPTLCLGIRSHPQHAVWQISEVWEASLKAVF